MNGKETLKCNHIVDVVALDWHPGLLPYSMDKINSDIGDALMSRIIDKGEFIVRAKTKIDQLNDIVSINIKETVEITRLIRCKDCKWSNEEGRCEVHETLSGNDFCSKGERREE